MKYDVELKLFMNHYRLYALLFTWIVSFVVMAEELPPGVPSPFGPDGRYTDALYFTTPAYREAAFNAVMREANQAAAVLGLPEELPIVRTNLVGIFIDPFGYAYAMKAIGNVTTLNYSYSVSDGNKLSYIASVHQDELGLKFQASHTLPVSQVNTNEALAQATHWLKLFPVDMMALNSNCIVKVEVDNVYVRPPAGKFVPVYDVIWWEKSGDITGGAFVRLFTPTRTLMQLDVGNAKYILRPPIVFTNLAELLSTNAPASTNAPVAK